MVTFKEIGLILLYLIAWCAGLAITFAFIVMAVNIFVFLLPVVLLVGVGALIWHVCRS